MSLVRHARGFVILSCFCLTLAATAQRGTFTAHRNLAQLTDGAANIVEGTVISATVEPHPSLTNLQTVVVTMRVAATLKGTAAGTFEFRQLIWDVRDRTDLAGYRRGEHLLLFMNRPSAYGLSSPVGMEQGRFRIVRDATGGMSAINGQANAGLLTGVAPRLAAAAMPAPLNALLQSHRQGPVRFPDLVELVRQLERAK